ncbi:DUF2613 family protein [Nocardioides houyundeii]|uniref:DUF2613 family protein n=1 Tax=Nocardioides houyundeii TaxID=2045452 RepID=UPI0013B39DD0|nr:DUF2613 family protein [Nocardioides houyundeii]
MLASLLAPLVSIAVGGAVAAATLFVTVTAVTSVDSPDSDSASTSIGQVQYGDE